MKKTCIMLGIVFIFMLLFACSNNIPAETSSDESIEKNPTEMSSDDSTEENPAESISYGYSREKKYVIRSNMLADSAIPESDINLLLKFCDTVAKVKIIENMGIIPSEDEINEKAFQFPCSYLKAEVMEIIPINKDYAESATSDLYVGDEITLYHAGGLISYEDYSAFTGSEETAESDLYVACFFEGVLLDLEENCEYLVFLTQSGDSPYYLTGDVYGCFSLNADGTVTDAAGGDFSFSSYDELKNTITGTVLHSLTEQLSGYAVAPSYVPDGYALNEKDSFSNEGSTSLYFHSQRDDGSHACIAISEVLIDDELRPLSILPPMGETVYTEINGTTIYISSDEDAGDTHLRFLSDGVYYSLEAKKDSVGAEELAKMAESMFTAKIG